MIRRADPMLVAVAGLVVVAVVFPGALRWVTRRAAAGVGGAAAGVVEGAGEAVGVPTTDAARCAQAKARCETFEASKYCPAGEFLSWWWSAKTCAPASSPAPAPRTPGPRRAPPASVPAPTDVEPWYL